MRAVKRLVVVDNEYLDGIMALRVHAPDTFHQTARGIPVSILDAYDAAWDNMRAAEAAVQHAWNVAKEVPNPNYAPDEADDLV